MCVCVCDLETSTVGWPRHDLRHTEEEFHDTFLLMNCMYLHIIHFKLISIGSHTPFLRDFQTSQHVMKSSPKSA